MAVRQAQVQYTQSRQNQLPTASGSGSYGYNYGFSVNPINNQVVSSGLTSGNLGLSGGVNLYSGFQVQNTIRQNEILLGANRTDKEQLERDIALGVAQAYVQVLLAKELYENAKIQFTSTQEQLSRTEKLIAAGTAAEAIRYTLDAQAASEKAAITNAENQVSLAMLALRQAMNAQPDTRFDLVQPDLSAYEPVWKEQDLTEIYRVSEGLQPNIVGAEMRARAALIGIELAKAMSRPSLSFFAQTNTRFSSIAMRPSGEFITVSQTVFFNGQPVQFGTEQPLYEKMPLYSQLARNWGLGLGLSLNVPIYNRGQMKTNVQLADINIKNAQLNTSIQKQALRQAIERAYWDVKIAYINYQAIEKQIESLNVIFENIQKQLKYGTGNQTDFVLAKNNVIGAQNNLSRAKYDFLFKLKILEFYRDGKIGSLNE